MLGWFTRLSHRATAPRTHSLTTRLADGLTRSASSCPQTEHPVTIVGAGPSGLTLALWLSRYGIPSLVLERATHPSTHPQAHYINNRTMEVLRPLAGLAADVVRATPPLSQWRSFRYGYSMTGELLGEVDHFPGCDSPHNTAISPEPVAHVPQSRLLPMLLSRVTAAGSRVVLQWGVRVTGCEVTQRGVRVRALDEAGRQLQYDSQFVIAADGAHSVLRQQLGIAMSGDATMQHLINIHFTSPSLGARMLGRGPGSAKPAGRGDAAAMLYFVFNRQVVGVVVAHDLEQGEFVAQVPYFPPLQSPTDFSESVCRDLVVGAAGLSTSDMPELRIRQVRPWIMSAVVADRFVYPSVPERSKALVPFPRVFLVGDAAHRFPPAGGFGMNTGIQDAHNLAWKLALALRSTGRQESGSKASADTDMLMDPGYLLRSYEAERRPVAQANCALSVRNWEEAVGVPSALGLNPKAASALDATVRAVPFLPASAGKALLEAGLAFGRAVTTSRHPLTPRLHASVKSVFESGVTLRLQFPREDLGFKYDSPGAAIATDLSAPASMGATVHKESEPKERALPYVPSSEPGCRLPHVWLEPLHKPAQQGASKEAGEDASQASGAQAAELLSTLDIAAGIDSVGFGPAFTLFISGSEQQCSDWLQAAESLRTDSGISLQPVIVLGPDQTDVPIPQIECLVTKDAEKAWHRVMGMPRGCALLVRPDGHIAWRAQAADSAVLAAQAAAEKLRDVLRRVMSGN